ncbi:DUF2079 domain-containing protein [Oryzomonas japonica]|uniref:DUF2079 domain-containing protein n=1 Tax=Oryzomonas japonica TaxID=2603858 RepID=A0A7J4ZT43_9BACT|nr:DUF2079 domain-containing protein [Oryzomonas japonica]KAB0666526.1 DUF2079 domain-containing protein [Oryzomonas japonica]
MTASKASSANGTFGINQARRVLFIVVCAHFALLLTIGLFRHWGYMTSLNDLGFFDQAVWGTLHGQWFLDTNNVFGQPINWLSCHFNPFLLLFVPLYSIWPVAEWFIVAQAFALSVAALPIFLLASRVHGSERTGLLWALIYLFNPFLLGAAAWDFHPVTIAVPFIATALLAVEKKNFRLLMFCCFWLLLLQEQFGITVACFGALWWFRQGDWKGSFLLVSIGLLHTILVLGFIMPTLSPSGIHSMIVDPGAKDSRYGWLGGSLSEIVGNIAFHPIRMLHTMITVHGTIRYIVFLSLPLLGLFLAAPFWLLPAIADFLANTLSANPMPRAITSYHSVTLVPILTVSAVYGAKRIATLFAKSFSVPITNWILLATAVLGYELAPLPLPGAINFWRPVQWVQVPDPALKQVRALVADRASLSVQANVGAHFSQRQQIFRYPFKVGEADAIVLRLDSPTLNIIPHNRQGIGTLAHHLQMNPAEYLASVDCLLQDPVYGVILWNDPWLVVLRGPKIAGADGLIRNRLAHLRNSWQITSGEYGAALQECRNKLQ